jgi:hypothetical protein
MAPTPALSDTTEVFEVLITSSRQVSSAAPHQSCARRGLSSAAAMQIAVPSAILPPRAFFSGHRPRQAPGKMESIRPMDGTNRPVNSDAAARMAKEVASTSASVAHE